MPYKRILLLIWISLMFIAAVYFVIKLSGPSSTLTTVEKLTGGGQLVLYNEAQLISQEEVDGRVELKVDGKAYIGNAKGLASYVIWTDEAKIEIEEGSAVINTTNPYTTEVIVSEGAVRFGFNPSSHIGRIYPITLNPGEKGLILPNAKGVVKQDNRDKNFMSWVDFNLVFDNESLGNAIEVIESTYGVSVTIDSPEIKRCRVSGRFEELTISNLIESLAEQLGINATEMEEDQWSLTGDGC